MIIQKLKMLISRSNQLCFRSIVAHQWTGSYLLKQYGWHYREALRLLSKTKNKSSSDWTGINVWGSPVVAMAPPHVSWKIRKCARLSVTKGAGDAMISYPTLTEMKDGTRA